MAARRRRKNFNDIVELLVYESSSDSDEDDLPDVILYEMAFIRKRVLGPRLNLQNVSEDDCEKMFRFQKEDVQRLLRALNMPNTYICEQGTKASALEALMITLRRLSYPNRWTDLVPLFGRSEYELSFIFNHVVDDLYDKERLTSLDVVWLDPEAFSQAIHAKGCPLTQCWGFIDGTAKRISRPIYNQKIMYSGHKRIHCLKFQSVQAPNGMIAHLFGPIEGWRHDAFMLGESGLLPKLRCVTKPNGEPYVVYGDPAYGLSRNILAPFRGAILRAEERESV